MPRRIPTGCKVIDRTLEGGIPSESLSLIYGEPETGKTTLTMECAVNCARQDHKTLFIDCDGTFSAKRLSQVASDEFPKIAELIILMRPSNFQEQSVIVDRLPDYVTKSFGLVIIDTLTSLYRVQVAESRKAFEVNRQLNKQLASLAQFARTQKIAILVTSQVRTAFNQARVSIEPVATRVVKFWADVVISMMPTESPRMIKVVFEKGTTKGQSKTCYLTISETGIGDC